MTEKLDRNTLDLIPADERLNYVRTLAARVKNGEIQVMLSSEVDALDQAIEDGIISEDELRVNSDAA